MDSIIKLLAGFEETAYKILMLVIIIPRTLLRIIFDPVDMRRYVVEQLGIIEENKKKPENQRDLTFADYFSPVLLLLTLALVPALLLAFLPPTGVTLTSSPVQESSTQFIFTGDAAFSSSPRGEGHQFRWEVLNVVNEGPSLVTAEIHSDADPGRTGIKYDENKATDTFTYNFDKEGNYRVQVSVRDQSGNTLFTDSKPVSVTADPRDPSIKKAVVANSDIVSGIQQNDLTIKSFSDVLQKDTTIFLAFSLMLPPLFFALIYSLATKKKIVEKEMRKIFYVQCYYFSPLSLTIWAFYYSYFFLTGGALQQSVGFSHFVPPMLALIWFVSVQTKALADEVEDDNINRLNAFFIVVACVIAMAVVGLVISVSFSDPEIRDLIREFIIGLYLLASFGLIGVYFINWWKARKQEEARKREEARNRIVEGIEDREKDKKVQVSSRLKWIGWLSVSIIALCSIVSIGSYLLAQPAASSLELTPVANATSSNEYREEFKQVNVNWVLQLFPADDTVGKADAIIKDDNVRLTLNPENDKYPTAVYIYDEMEYTNVQIETSAKSNNGNSHSVSLVCRYTESGWYEFEVSGSGDYYIHQVNVENNIPNYTVLTSGYSPVVEVGVENTYTAVCNGNNLSLSINHIPVVEPPINDPDSKFSQGKVGVAIYSPQTQKVDVQFSYVAITLKAAQASSSVIGGATATPTSTPPAPDKERFNEALDGWNVFGDRSRIVDIKNNSLQIQLPENEGSIVYLINGVSSYSDASIEVVVIDNNGNNSGVIELICRYTENSWYGFEVSGAGWYTIYAYNVSSGWTELESDSVSVIPEQGPNTYKASCEGNELKLLVNGETVATFQETEFNYAEGLSGFGVYSWDGSLVDISVDSVTLVGEGSQSSAPDLGAPTVVPDAEVTPTATPVTSVSQFQQFFTEEFDTVDNWTYFVVDGDKSSITYEDNPNLSIFADNSAMTFEINAISQWVYLTYDPFEYRDVRIDMHVNNRGANTNDVSLVCRYTDTGWYEFNVGNDGLYTIYYAEVDAGGFVNYVPLFEGGSAAIKSGKGVNEYSAVCAGNVLSLFINGEQARVITEDKFNLTSGKVGIAVSSYEILPVSIDVDWVTISEP